MKQFSDLVLVMWLIVLRLARVACTRTSVLELTNRHSAVVVGTETSRACVHTRSICLTQYNVIQLSILDLIAATFEEHRNISVL